MPAVVTFDGPNRIITEIDAAGDNELDVVEIYSEWKEWVVTSDNSKFLQAFSQVGGDPISPTQNLGTTFFLENGWRIRPAESDHKLTVVGNVFTREAGQSVFVTTIGSFTVNTETRVSNLVDSSVSRLDLTQLLQAVYIDVDNGVSGAGDGVGTPTQPVNNIADARTIADRDGLRAYRFRGALVLDQDYQRWTFESLGAEPASSVDFAGYNVDKSRFEGCVLTGVTAGVIEAERCGINLFSDIAGVFRGCGLLSNFSIQAGGTAVFADCFSEVPGQGSPICDINAGIAVSFRNYSGGIELLNVTGTEEVSVDLDPGTLTLGPTNTGGTVRVRGVGVVVDNSNGTTVLKDSLVKADELDLLFYERSVSFDSVRGTTGQTNFPAGTAGRPVAAEADAKSIADTIGVRTYDILGVMNLAVAHQDWQFVGTGGSTSRVNLNGQDVAGSKFQAMNVQGAMVAETAIIEARNGPFGNISGLRGTVVECGVFGTISFGAAANTNRFVRCQQGNVAPTFDCTNIGASSAIVFALWDGAMTISNLSAGTITLDSLGAEITLDASCTGGTLRVRGLARITDNSGQVTVDRTTMVDAEEMKIVEAAIAGRAKVAPNDLTIDIKDPAGATLRTLSVSADGRVRGIV